MRIKFITAISEKKLQAKVNDFLETYQHNIEIIDMQFQMSYGGMGVMIRYKKKM